MNYKIICIDVDGTLYNSKGRVSKENKEAIEKAYKKGIEVVICTGRIFVNAVQISKSLGLNCTVIGANGALVKDPNKNISYFKQSFSKEELSYILQILEKHNVITHFYTEDKVIANSIIGKICALGYKLKSLSKGKNIKVHSSTSKKALKKVIKEEERNLYKCAIYSLDKELIRTVKKEIKESSILTVVGAGSYALEVSSKGVSKGLGVKILAEKLKVNRDEIICIGDNENDIKMVKYAGVGIAMGNAIEDLKKVSDYITESNDESGVGKAINKFLL